jgi:hypothetical protein
MRNLTWFIAAVALGAAVAARATEPCDSALLFRLQSLTVDGVARTPLPTTNHWAYGTQGSYGFDSLDPDTNELRRLDLVRQ